MYQIPPLKIKKCPICSGPLVKHTNRHGQFIYDCLSCSKYFNARDFDRYKTLLKSVSP